MIPLIREYNPIIKIGISKSIIQIVNPFESQKTKEQTNYEIYYFMFFLTMKIYKNSIPNICFRNTIWPPSFFLLSISDYHYTFGYFRKKLYFGLNGIKNA